MELYETIIQQSWNDPEFKKQFINNPRETLSALGQPLAANVSLEIHQDSLDTMHFVLLDRSQVDVASLGNDPISKVTRIAHEDESFRSRLLSSPKEAVQEVLGFCVPATIHVHANTPDHIHLVLPINPNFYGELSDSDLAVVAGGKGAYAKTCSGISSILKTVGNALPGLGSLLTGGASVLDMVSKMF